MSKDAGRRRVALRQLAQRGGVMTATVGVVVATLLAAFIMRAALISQAEKNRDDLGALLVASSRAAVALEDYELLQETLDELGPALIGLVRVDLRDAAGKEIAVWQRDVRQSQPTLSNTLPILGFKTEVVGSVELEISAAHVDQAIISLWKYLGGVAAVCVLLSFLASVIVGRELAEKIRLEEEIDIADRIQTGVLPKRLDLDGWKVGAKMTTATEVGGDYYDAIKSEDGGWICIGDVAGHGLPAGIMMLMMQSSLAVALSSKCLGLREALSLTNAILYENFAERLGIGKYATLQVGKYNRNGHVRFAGGHLDVLVHRVSTGKVELLAAEGPFMGLEPELEPSAIVETGTELQPGDTVLLYTDGVTEARGPGSKELFGIERLCSSFERLVTKAPQDIVDDLTREVQSWSPQLDDDVTLVAVRYDPSVVRDPVTLSSVEEAA